MKVFYVGTAFGSMIAGRIADKHGRRPSIIFSSICIFFITLSFYFIPNEIIMIMVRFLYGFVFGFSLPLTTSMFSEICPIK